MNVDRMLRSITAKQFMQWEAYASIEPFGELRADYRMAAVRKTLYELLVPIAAAIGVKSFDSQASLDNFMLKFKSAGDGDDEEPTEDAPKPQGQSWETKKMIAYAIATAFSGVSAKDLD